MENNVKKREIFYLGGYDPRGARSYYNLYKKESKKNAKIDSLTLSVEQRKKETNHIQSWLIKNLNNNNRTQVETKYNFLEWDDIIRKTWKKTFFDFVLDMLSIIKIYYLSGLIVKFAKLVPLSLKPMLYPFLYILITLILSFFLSIISIYYLHETLNFYLSLFLSFIPVYFLIQYSHTLGNKIAVFWTLRTLLFYGTYCKNTHNKLDERVEHFQEYILQSMKSPKSKDIDEFLIIAHSAGTIVLIDLLFEIFQSIEKKDKVLLSKISILTLGQCIPIVSFLDEASEYRKKMGFIANYSLNWIDITAPADEVSFSLLDYFTHSGVQLPDKKPLFLSPRFHLLFTAQSYKKLKKNVYLLHFLYIMSTEKVGVYNYFQITAGNQYLFNRFKDNSK